MPRRLVNFFGSAGHTDLARFVRASVVVTLTTAYLAYVFQVPAGTPRTHGLGDWLDPYFINVLLEHWYFSLVRLENPLSPPMFFPATGTLGYSHSLVLFAPFYVAVRPFVDPFVAHTLTIFVVAELGALCLYVLLRRTGLHFVETLILHAFFLTSANVINPDMSRWSQRASIFLIPPIVLILLTALGLPVGALRLAAALAGGFLAASLLTQEFYTAAFAALVVAFVAPVALRRPHPGWLRRLGLTVTPREAPPHDAWLAAGVVLVVAAALIAVTPVPPIEIAGIRLVSARDPLRPLLVGLLLVGWYAWRRWRVTVSVAGRFKSLFRADRWLLAAAVSIGAIVGCRLFLLIYLPTYLEHRVFPEEQLWSQLRQPTFRWNSPVDVIRDLVAYNSVRTFAFVLLLPLIALTPRSGASLRGRCQLVWLTVVSAIVLALPLRIDDISVWKETFGWLPGLSVIRDPKRVVYAYELAAVIVLGVVIAASERRSTFRFGAMALAVALMAYDWNRATFEYDRPRDVFARWVQPPIDIDPSCRSFFMKTASAAYMSRFDNMWGQYSNDAHFIALHHDIPTLQGYSAWVPAEYNMLHPNDGDYMQHVVSWIRRHQLEGVCALDIDRRTMTPFVVPSFKP